MDDEELKFAIWNSTNDYYRHAFTCPHSILRNLYVNRESCFIFQLQLQLAVGDDCDSFKKMDEGKKVVRETNFPIFGHLLSSLEKRGRERETRELSISVSLFSNR